MRNKTVLISGASIAGPALAYWLHRYGFDVTVVERAPRLRPGGQAIDFKGPTHRAVLERMGVWEEIVRQRTGTTDVAFADESGRELAVMSGDFTGGDVEILRGDLARILYEPTAESCEYLFGDSITALSSPTPPAYRSPSETGDGVHVEFEHAPARTFDLVFGADGIHSRVRWLAFGPERDYVHHLGYYYVIAGAATAGYDSDEPCVRRRGHGYNAPGRLAVRGDAFGNHSKAGQHYIFASPEIDIPRDDVAAQQRILAEAFSGVGGPVPAMLDELPALDDFYLDSISQVRMKGRYTKGRIALIGDSAYGNTLGGFGTGLAVVGAYVLAGELAASGGEHTEAFARYDEIMRRYAKIAGNPNTGRFLAPRTARGIAMRNWFLGSRAFALMAKFGDRAAKDIDLRDYPAAVSASV